MTDTAVCFNFQDASCQLFLFVQEDLQYCSPIADDIAVSNGSNQNKPFLHCLAVISAAAKADALEASPVSCLNIVTVDDACAPSDEH